MNDPTFQELINDGALPIFMHRLAFIDRVKLPGIGFYSASAGGAGLEPVQRFAVKQWLADLDRKRAEVSATGWMP